MNGGIKEQTMTDVHIEEGEKTFLGTLSKKDYRHLLLEQHATAWAATTFWAGDMNKLMLWKAGLLAAMFGIYKQGFASLIPMFLIAHVFWFLLYSRASAFYNLNIGYLSHVRELICRVDCFESYIYNRFHEDKSKVTYKFFEGHTSALLVTGGSIILNAYLYWRWPRLEVVSPPIASEYTISLTLLFFTAASLMFFVFFPSHDFIFKEDELQKNKNIIIQHYSCDADNACQDPGSQRKGE